MLEDEAPASVSKRWNYGSGEYTKQLQIFPRPQTSTKHTPETVSTTDPKRIVDLVGERSEKVIFEINKTRVNKGVQYAVKTEGSENAILRWEDEEWLAKFMSEAIRM